MEANPQANKEVQKFFRPIEPVNGVAPESEADVQFILELSGAAGTERLEDMPAFSADLLSVLED